MSRVDGTRNSGTFSTGRSNGHLVRGLRYTRRPCFLRMWRNWQTRQLEVLVGQPMEVRVLSCALTVADPATVFLFGCGAHRAAPDATHTTSTLMHSRTPTAPCA